MTEPQMHLLPSVALTDLPTGTPIVCATLRLAQTLSRTHDERTHQSPAWQTLQATTLGQWLNNLYEALTLRGQTSVGLNGLRVLNTFQEQLIWEKVIRSQIDTSVE